MADLKAFKLGMRRLVSGVSLITTMHKGQSYGLIATSVVSVSAEPPTLLACLNGATSAHDPLAASGVFCVNLLDRADASIAATFSDKARRHERFREGEWMALQTGAPALRSAIAVFDCTVAKSLQHGSHTIFLGLVQAVRLQAAAEPLIYADGRYRLLA